MTFINIGGFMKDNIICDDCKKEVEENDDFDGYYCPHCGSNDTNCGYNDDYPNRDGGYDEYGTLVSCRKCKREFIVEEV